MYIYYNIVLCRTRSPVTVQQQNITKILIIPRIVLTNFSSVFIQTLAFLNDGITITNLGYHDPLFSQLFMFGIIKLSSPLSVVAVVVDPRFLLK